MLYSMTEDGDTITYDYLDGLDMGDSVTLELKEDGSGTLALFDEVLPLTWKKGTLSTCEGSVSYTYQDEKLTFSTDGTDLIFQKATAVKSKPKPQQAEDPDEEDRAATGTAGGPWTSAAATIRRKAGRI